VNTAFESTATATHLEELTTSYWDRNLWDGIVTGDSYPRTDEFSREYANKATAFGWEWQVTCPLCREALAALDIDSLDYHHWQKEPDQGVCLCRACHEAISGGSTDTKQDWRAQQLGLKNKYDLQITRLALREQMLADHDTIDALATTLHRRYNLIQPASVVVDLLDQTLRSETVLERVTDEYLTAGIDTDQNA
jgi:hypothetical protein